MDFSLSEEQRILQSTLRRFLDSLYSFERRRIRSMTKDSFDRECWAEFARLGILAVPFPEACGGLGGGAVDLSVVMREFGRFLVTEPFFATVVLAGGVVRCAGSPAQKEAIIGEIVSGDGMCALAHLEEQSRFNLADVGVTARKDGGSYLINGTKRLVLCAPAADWIFVTARTAGGSRDRLGVTLFRVGADARGLSRLDYPTIDGGRASDLTFENVRVGGEDIFGEVDCANAVMDRVVDEALLALCAEALGAMEALNDATIAYASTRTAFGQAIAKFQTIRHRLVNMKLAAQQASALAFGAASALDNNDEDAPRLISAAKAKIGKEGRAISQGAVQIHGGIGITDELNVGHYMKRLIAIEALLGDRSHHTRRFGDLSEGRKRSRLRGSC